MQIRVVLATGAVSAAATVVVATAMVVAASGAATDLTPAAIALRDAADGSAGALPISDSRAERLAQDSGITIVAPDAVFAAGATARHTVTLTSWLGQPDTVRLRLSGGAWSAELPPAIAVPAGGAVTTAVTVTVPFTATARMVDVSELVAITESDGAEIKTLLTTRTGGVFRDGRYLGCRFDLDGDGEIGASDVSMVARGYNSSPEDESYDSAFDFDHSGRIGAGDVQAVAGRQGTTCRVVPSADSAELRASITADGLRGHLAALQDAAGDAAGHRAAGSQGFLASQSYVDQLLADAGLSTRLQELPYPHFSVVDPPVLERVTPSRHDYGGSDFRLFQYSGSGDVTAGVQFVDVVIPPPDRANTSTSGCQQSDFDDFEPGRIAFVQRGTCGFHGKASRAEGAGAAGVVIFNEGQPGGRGVFVSRLSAPGIEIPVYSASFTMAEELHGLVEAGRNVRLRMAVETESEYRPTHNLIADLPGANDDVVVLGAHLDSVKAGAGINDNGSGSAAILEIALRMADLDLRPVNTVRFAFWGAEELGLLGSDFYVDNLTPVERRQQLMNLNFDMIASPNYARFVYDGDGSLSPQRGPEGSAEIEYLFTRFFDESGLPSAETPFSGRSDYGPFIVAGIPAGGLFTGTGEKKTAAEEAVFGGKAGVPYDSCYHQACDDIDNIAWDVYLQHTHAAAHAALSYAGDDGFGYETAGAPASQSSLMAPDRLDPEALDFWGPAPRR